MKTIGERIKFRRIELGLSQDELAQKLNYKSRSSINKIELGHQNLTQSKIKAIADALETTPAYIMGWTGNNQTKSENKKTNGCKMKLDPLDEILLKLLANATDEDKQMLISLLERLQDKK